MIKNDYIMRMIEQFSKVLARVLFNTGAQHWEEAQTDVQDAALNFLGISLRMVRRLPTDDLLAMMTVGGRLDTAKCYIAAQLLLADARIHEGANEAGETAESSFRALELMTVCLPQLPRDARDGAREQLDEITGRLAGIELPPDMLERLMATYEELGRYARAEDCLFELIDRDWAPARDLGERFYHRLMARTDAQLEDGDLSREEVDDGLVELRQRLGG